MKLLKRNNNLFGILSHKYPDLFLLKKKETALGFAISMGIGVIPLPIQIISSIIACIIFRANIPAALMGALIMNPLTTSFVLMFAFYLGSFFYQPMLELTLFPDILLLADNPSAWVKGVLIYLEPIWETLLYGIPLTMMLVFGISYFTVIYSWKLVVIYRWKHRHLKK